MTQLTKCSMYRDIIVILVILASICESCPFPCVCRWKNGKQTAECTDKDLLIIPESFDAETQVLEFSGNNLVTLHRDKFLRLRLINLQRIYLSRCHIRVIQEQSFKGLTNLVELDLSENLLVSIPSASFYNCPALMRLMLNRNPIKTIEKGAFQYLPALNKLELSSCDVIRVDEKAFLALSNLEWLHLDSNKLTTFPADLGLPSLKGIQLQENPWQCDCCLRNFQDWLAHLTFPLIVEPICRSPSKLKGRPIKEVPKSDLACVPKIIPAGLYVEVNLGSNVSLMCQVDSIPLATVSWYFEDRLLQNETILSTNLQVRKSHEHSELFIHNAGAAVNGTFLCCAENRAGATNANFTIRVLVPMKDFVEDSSNSSFHVILIAILIVTLLVFLALMVAICIIIRSRKNYRLSRKRKISKASLDHSRNENTPKNNDQVKIVDLPSNKELLSDITSLESLECKQRPNPDLINGAEGKGRRCVSSLKCCQYMLETINENQEIDSSAFFGNSVAQTNSANGSSSWICGTLTSKKQTAAVPIGRLAREEEFLSRSALQPISYEYFGCDLRYTADGYPARFEDGSQQSMITSAALPASHSSINTESTTESENVTSVKRGVK